MPDRERTRTQALEPWGRNEPVLHACRAGQWSTRQSGRLRPGDVDFLVDFEPGRSLLDVSGLILDLEELLGVRVDVVEASALRSGDAHVLDDAISL